MVLELDWREFALSFRPALYSSSGLSELRNLPDEGLPRSLMARLSTFNDGSGCNVRKVRACIASTGSASKHVRDASKLACFAGAFAPSGRNLPFPVCG